MTMNFNEISDAIMLPVLEKMAPPEREKLLILLRQLAHPRAYPWIDAQPGASNQSQKRQLTPKQNA
jgi:hypothetical protein